MKYNHKQIDAKWQQRWERDGAFVAREDDARQKYYALIEFPYPSGEGLHVGHPRPYIGMDVIARKRRMEGKNVLYPIGWDAFGLPAENYAIKHGIHPREATQRNIENFKRQIQAMGVSFDWSREVNTTDPKYYKWTQWIFLQLLKHGLAYKAKMPINWCLRCKIGLANEEVVGGKCERCGGEVEKRDKEQWMLAITKYADKLLEGLEHVNYIDRAKVQQVNWIGKSEGAKIGFPVMCHSERSEESHAIHGRDPSSKIPQDDTVVEVFTTRPDTLFGATYLVLAPEHPFLERLRTTDYGLRPEWKEIEEYVHQAREKTDIERTAEEKEKTGVELQGVYAINPANGEEIPIWVADYVLAHYGTGAIMAVPAHDERDFAFAKKYGLPIRHVIRRIDVPSRSYVMGAEEMTEEDFSVIGVDVVEKTKEGHYKVEIPRGREQEFEGLITEKLTPGFWNEYIGDETVFLFKHKDGRVERLVLDRKNVERIDRLACEFNNEPYNPDDSGNYINGALAHNEWYRPIIVHCNQGVLVNSGKFDGMSSEEASAAITKEVGGAMTTSYRLRDWVFSRQRYWGEPIPVVFCAGCASSLCHSEESSDEESHTPQSSKASESASKIHNNIDGMVVEIDGVDYAIVPIPEDQLPLELPEVETYVPTDTGESPLAAITDWVNTECPQCGGPAMRETDVMPNWAGSSWYFLRYCDPYNERAFADSEKLKHWMPVDWYNGGMEHTTLHLLYSRFWNQFLYDIGVVPCSEPYRKRTSHGMILAEDGEKMSKSKGNVINPDDIIAEHGADAFRVYEMFMGPFDQAIAWSTRGVVGMRRFLERVAALRVQEITDKGEGTRGEQLIHKTIRKVTDDIEEMRFNTAISTMMILTNEFTTLENVPRDAYEILLRLLSPFAPHLCEELWEQLGHTESIMVQPWPEYNSELAKDEEIDLVVQVNGKLRATIRVVADISEDEAKLRALADEHVQKYTNGMEPKKVIVVPGKLVNIVV
ncbi:MAG: class I tRNA ligase family protein [Candidatus Uhrbacteria bacterium]